MEEPEKIKLPKELQVQMLEFFMKTSIPKSIKQNTTLSINNNEREGMLDENGSLCEGVDGGAST